MPPLVFEYDKGVSNQDEVRLPQGFVTRMQNWVYDPDDRDRVFKIFGRTNNGSLPSSATAANTIGFDFFQYENGLNKFVIGTNSSLYETGVSDSIGAWTQVVDKQAVPVAFPIMGTVLKVLASGDNRYIVFDGTHSSRPLVRDEMGDWHYLGMSQPPPLDLSQVTLLGVVTRPTTQTNPTSVDVGPTGEGRLVGSGTGFTAPTRAYDNDVVTFAQTQIQGFAVVPFIRPGLKATDWAFTAVGTTPSPQKLTIVVGAGAPTWSLGNPPQSPFGSSYYANLVVQVSTNSGGAYTTVFRSVLPVEVTAVTTNIAAGVTWANIRVRVYLQYLVGAVYVEGYVFEIYAKAQDQGGSTFVPEGVYTYAQTEVYEVLLPSGKTIKVESPASKPISVTIPANTAYGVSLTLPGAQTTNTLDDGYKDDPTNNRRLYRRIYRSTSTGTWPDLGFIGTAAIDATVFVDDFIAVSGTTLGTPTINVVYAGVAALDAAAAPPGFLDAVLFRSTLVWIPADDQYRIQWSLPGVPDYWPRPAHDLSALPTARNDRLVGIGSVGEYLILFTRTRLLRLRDLPYVDRPNFDPALIQVNILSPNEGLAGGVLSYCTFQSQKGFSVLAWVSDSGIWMTDGSLPSEGGLGIVKLTSNLNWRKFVDTRRLTSSRMVYDPVLQMIFFDYYDTAGAFRTLCLHTAPDHWVQSGQDHTVPKVSGPHTHAKLSRVIGEFQSTLRHWSLDASRLKLYNERTGNGDDGQPILSVMETGWQQPSGPQEEYLCNLGSLYHSDWGPSETCDLDLLARRDDTGVIQEVRKGGLSLAGAAVTNFYINAASKSLRVRITHNGLTTSDGQAPIRALGPVGVDGEVMDALFGV